MKKESNQGPPGKRPAPPPFPPSIGPGEYYSTSREEELERVINRLLSTVSVCRLIIEGDMAKPSNFTEVIDEYCEGAHVVMRKMKNTR